MPGPKRVTDLGKNFRHALKTGGPRFVLQELGRKLQGTPAEEPAVHRMQTEAAAEDILGVDWDFLANRTPETVPKGSSLKVAYVMSPPAPSSGGHQNIFRFMSYLERAGHECEVFITSQIDHRTVSEVERVLMANYDRVDAPLSRWRGDLRGANVVIATGWETCYPVANALKGERAVYFVQDFEPLFFPASSAAALAENTYRMGFTGITAGPWLSQKLSTDYGMDAASYSFGVKLDLYTLSTQHRERPAVFYYARPDTARRGLELGLLTLREFHRRRPDVEIHLAGGDMGDWKFEFPCRNHGALPLAELPALYNKCDAGLVLSLTNLSLLPNELLACGVVPVMNGGPNTELVCTNEHALFARAEPNDLATGLERALDSNHSQARRAQLRSSIEGVDWDAEGARFVDLVETAASGSTIAGR